MSLIKETETVGQGKTTHNLRFTVFLQLQNEVAVSSTRIRRNHTNKSGLAGAQVDARNEGSYS